MCLHEPMPTCLKLATWRLHILWKENKSLPCLSHFHCVSTLILANAVITHVHIQYFLRLYKLLYLSFCFQFSSVTKSRPTIRNPMNCSRPCFPVHHHSQSLCKFMSIESVIPSKHLILCCPLLLLPSVFSSIGVFSSESATVWKAGGIDLNYMLNSSPWK